MARCSLELSFVSTKCQEHQCIHLGDKASSTLLCFFTVHVIYEFKSIKMCNQLIKQKNDLILINIFTQKGLRSFLERTNYFVKFLNIYMYFTESETIFNCSPISLKHYFCHIIIILQQITVQFLHIYLMHCKTINCSTYKQIYIGLQYFVKKLWSLKFLPYQF